MIIAQKREVIFYYLQQKKYSTHNLQDTHFTDDDVNKVGVTNVILVMVNLRQWDWQSYLRTLNINFYNKQKMGI